MATWKMPVTTRSNLTGDMIATAGPDGCAVIVNPGLGTARFSFAADTIYLDGSATPTSFGALPSGWTPTDAYIFHWHATLIDAADTLSVALGSGTDPTQSGPLFDDFIDSARTGATTAVLQNIAVGSITVTATTTNQAGFGNLLDIPPGEFFTWFEGTYAIVAVTLPRVGQMPTRTPIRQGDDQASSPGGRRRG
jgi:hypothetical protein